MNGDITLLTLFLLGFFGGGHCVGMCGGLSSAFALQLPPGLNRTGLIVLLNLGRISSYVFIGLLWPEFPAWPPESKASAVRFGNALIRF